MGPQPKRCHNCKSEEHLIADCPLRTASQKGSESGDGKGQNGDGEKSSSDATTVALSEAVEKLQVE